MAGVSQKTVSRVYNNERYVSADARRRALKAAAKLGYRRNNAARTLDTRSIGVVTLGTALYGPASPLVGIERAARDIGYALRVVTTMEGDPAGISGAVKSLLDQGVDGIVISEPIGEGGLALDFGVPVLVLDPSGAFSGPRVVTAGVRADDLAKAADPGHGLEPFLQAGGHGIGVPGVAQPQVAGQVGLRKGAHGRSRCQLTTRSTQRTRAAYRAHSENRIRPRNGAAS
jgi:hypothetical protein